MLGWFCIFLEALGNCSQHWYLQNQWKSLALIYTGVFIFPAYVCIGKIVAGLAVLKAYFLNNSC